MRNPNAIKSFFKSLLSRKKREPMEAPLFEKMKTFYDIESLKMAQVGIEQQKMFGEKRILQAGEGKEVYFMPYKNLSVDPVSNQPAEK